MSNIQRENGHIDIANKLIESLMKTHLSGREWQIIMVIIRQTWGYCELKDGHKYKDKNGFWVKKKIDRISHSQFEKFTGINRRKIWDILNGLVDKNMIIKTVTKKGDITVCNYGIQKDSSKWILPSPKKGTVPKKGDRVSPKKGIEGIPKKGAYKRKDTKETIQKKTLSRTFTSDDPVYQLTIYLEGKIMENNKAVTKKEQYQIQNWCKNMDLLIRKDKAKPRDIKKVIDWVVEDKFWAKNILCPASLRKQYPRFYKEVIDRGRSLEERIEADHRLDDVD
jgi:hypothetical protein